MNITRFMSLGLFWLSIFFPIPCILICHLMFKWQEKGILGSEETAKVYIRYSLVSITIHFIICFSLALIAIFLNFNAIIAFLPTISLPSFTSFSFAK